MTKRKHDDTVSICPKRLKATTNTSHTLIPNDCLLSIFEFCNAENLKYSLPLVCVLWNSIVIEYETLLWRQLCFQEWSPVFTLINKDTFAITNWKLLYEEFGCILNTMFCIGMCRIHL
jgi:hypothetical protein